MKKYCESIKAGERKANSENRIREMTQNQKSTRE